MRTMYQQTTSTNQTASSNTVSTQGRHNRHTRRSALTTNNLPINNSEQPTASKSSSGIPGQQMDASVDSTGMMGSPRPAADSAIDRVNVPASKDRLEGRDFVTKRNFSVSRNKGQSSLPPSPGSQSHNNSTYIKRRYDKSTSVGHGSPKRSQSPNRSRRDNSRAHSSNSTSDVTGTSTVYSRDVLGEGLRGYSQAVTSGGAGGNRAGPRQQLYTARAHYNSRISAKASNNNSTSIGHQQLVQTADISHHRLSSSSVQWDETSRKPLIVAGNGERKDVSGHELTTSVHTNVNHNINQDNGDPINTDPDSGSSSFVIRTQHFRNSSTRRLQSGYYNGGGGSGDQSSTRLSSAYGGNNRRYMGRQLSHYPGTAHNNYGSQHGLFHYQQSQETNNRYRLPDGSIATASTAGSSRPSSGTLPHVHRTTQAHIPVTSSYWSTPTWTLMTSPMSLPEYSGGSGRTAHSSNATHHSSDTTSGHQHMQPLAFSQFPQASFSASTDVPTSASAAVQMNANEQIRMATIFADYLYRNYMLQQQMGADVAASMSSSQVRGTTTMAALPSTPSIVLPGVTSSHSTSSAATSVYARGGNASIGHDNTCDTTVHSLVDQHPNQLINKTRDYATKSHDDSLPSLTGLEDIPPASANLAASQTPSDKNTPTSRSCTTSQQDGMTSYAAAAAASLHNRPSNTPRLSELTANATPPLPSPITDKPTTPHKRQPTMRARGDSNNKQELSASTQSSPMGNSVANAISQSTSDSTSACSLLQSLINSSCHDRYNHHQPNGDREPRPMPPSPVSASGWSAAMDSAIVTAGQVLPTMTVSSAPSNIVSTSASAVSCKMPPSQNGRPVGTTITTTSATTTSDTRRQSRSHQAQAVYGSEVKSPTRVHPRRTTTSNVSVHKRDGATSTITRTINATSATNKHLVPLLSKSNSGIGLNSSTDFPPLVSMASEQRLESSSVMMASDMTNNSSTLPSSSSAISSNNNMWNRVSSTTTTTTTQQQQQSAAQGDSSAVWPVSNINKRSSPVTRVDTTVPPPPFRSSPSDNQLQQRDEPSVVHKLEPPKLNSNDASKSAPSSEESCQQSSQPPVQWSQGNHSRERTYRDRGCDRDSTGPRERQYAYNSRRGGYGGSNSANWRSQHSRVGGPGGAYSYLGRRSDDRDDREHMYSTSSRNTDSSYPGNRQHHTRWPESTGHQHQQRTSMYAHPTIPYTGAVLPINPLIPSPPMDMTQMVAMAAMANRYHLYQQQQHQYHLQQQQQRQPVQNYDATAQAQPHQLSNIMLIPGTESTADHESRPDEHNNKLMVPERKPERPTEQYHRQHGTSFDEHLMPADLSYRKTDREERDKICRSQSFTNLAWQHGGTSSFDESSIQQVSMDNVTGQLNTLSSGDDPNKQVQIDEQNAVDMQAFLSNHWKMYPNPHELREREEPLYRCNLSSQIMQTYNECIQTEHMYNCKLRLTSKLADFLSHIYPGCSLHMIGSSLNGFGSKTSDLDLCLLISNQQIDQRTTAVTILDHVRQSLPEAELGDVYDEQLITAKVPILRFNVGKQFNSIQVDVNVNNTVAIRNTHLLKQYSSFDRRVRPLVVVVKEWAKRQTINDPLRSSFSSYSLELMVIHFLQAVSVPRVVPNLQELYPESFGDEIDVRSLINGNKLMPPNTDDQHLMEIFNPTVRQSLAELLRHFMYYYAYEFAYSTSIISIRHGGIMSRSEGLDCMYIEEPFTQTNTAHSIYDRRVFERLKTCFAEAYNKLEETADLNSIMRKIQPSFHESASVNNLSASRDDGIVVLNPARSLPQIAVGEQT